MKVESCVYSLKDGLCRNYSELDSDAQRQLSFEIKKEIAKLMGLKVKDVHSKEG